MLNAAAFQNILDSKRCNCNALKAQGVTRQQDADSKAPLVHRRLCHFMGVRQSVALTG